MYTKDQFKSWYLVLIGFFYAGQGYALGSMVLLLPLYILNELDIGVRSEAVAISALIIFPCTSSSSSVSSPITFPYATTDASPT